MSVTSVASVAFRIEAGRGECDSGHRRFRNTPLRLQDYDRHDSIIWSVGWPRLPYLGLLDGTMRHAVGCGGSGSRGGAAVRVIPMAGSGSLQAVNKPGSSSFLLKEAAF